MTIYATSASSLTALDDEVLQAMGKAERMGWEWLAKRETATSAEYGAAMAVPNRTTLNHLRHLAELGLVRKRGSARSTYYEVIRP